MFCCVALPSVTAYSCDVCGSNIGNTGIGLLTDYRSNFLRLNYNLNPFESSTERGYLIKDDFHQVDLSLRYAVTDRIRLMAQVPYASKSRSVQEETLTEQGLGDISINANYIFLENQSFLWNTKLHVEAGLGVSLPTGRFDAKLHDRNLPESFNLGNGALGYNAQANVVWTYNSAGLVLNIFHQVNTETDSGYRFGNPSSLRLTAFKAWNKGNLQWIPNLGLGLEQLSSDRYARGSNVPNTGGKGLFLSTGINIQTQKWLAGLSYALPVADDFAVEATTVKGRINGQISFLF
ncbi:MAG: hypothetical protein AB8F74_09265 [Saprospiraceae bacterium]